MEIKKIRLPKSMKFLTLLLTSLLIAVASAQVYTYMYIQGTITVGATKLQWDEGADLSDYTTITGSTATITMNINGTGAPANFTYGLYLGNEYSGAVNDIEIKVTNAVLGADFNEAKMHILTNATGNPTTWQYLDYVDLETLNDAYTGSMNATDIHWLMTFEVNVANNPLTDGVFEITVKY